MGNEVQKKNILIQKFSILHKEFRKQLRPQNMTENKEKKLVLDEEND